MPEEERKFEITYVDNKASTTVPVSGAFGGFTPDGGALVAHFYLEYNPPPNMILADVDNQGRVDIEHGQPIKRSDLVREVQSTFMMSPEAAVSIGDWLKKRGEALLQQRNQ